MQTERISDRAVVLKWRLSGDGDGIGTFLTKSHGLLKMVAKGGWKSKKRYSGALDLFHHVNFSGQFTHGSEWCRMTEATLLNSFGGIRLEYERLWMASCCVEVILRSVDLNRNAGTEKEYILLGQVLAQLSAAPLESRHWIGTVFLTKWFLMMGWLPDAADCSSLFNSSLKDEPLWQSLMMTDSVTLLLRPPEYSGARLFDALLAFAGREHGLDLITVRGRSELGLLR